MRKEYIKPDVNYESFVLSESIAAGCNEDGIGVTNAYIELGLFSSNIPSNNQNISSCTDDYDEWVESGIIEEYCYWQGSFLLFLS